MLVNFGKSDFVARIFWLKCIPTKLVVKNHSIKTLPINEERMGIKSLEISLDLYFTLNIPVLSCILLLFRYCRQCCQECGRCASAWPDENSAPF